MDLNNYVNQIYSNKNSIIYFWRKSRDWPASESGQSSEWCKVAKAGAEAAVVETVVYNVHCNSEKTGLHTLHSCSLQTSWSATVFALALSVSAAAGAMFHPSLHKSQGWLCQSGQPGLPHVATPMSRQYGSWSFRVLWPLFIYLWIIISCQQFIVTPPLPSILHINVGEAK